MIYLDSTAITHWLQCREEYRLRHLEGGHGISPKEPSIHQAFGHSVHLAVEAFWHGKPYEEALSLAVEDMAKFPESLLNPHTAEKWRELGSVLCDSVATYYDGVTYEEGAEAEKEFDIAWNGQLRLCGKIDRWHRNTLVDVKTASEIGRTWKADYRASLLRSFQFGLYDWSHRVRENAPVAVKVECLVKPYRGKPGRLEVFDLPEILAYRKRFDQQLAWILTEITEYHENYLSQKPWPMAASHACSHKFGQCEMLAGCNKGWTPKILEDFKPREEHLLVRLEAAEQRP